MFTKEKTSQICCHKTCYLPFQNRRTLDVFSGFQDNWVHWCSWVHICGKPGKEIWLCLPCQTIWSTHQSLAIRLLDQRRRSTSGGILCRKNGSPLRKQNRYFKPNANFCLLQSAKLYMYIHQSISPNNFIGFAQISFERVKFIKFDNRSLKVFN